MNDLHIYFGLLIFVSGFLSGILAYRKDLEEFLTWTKQQPSHFGVRLLSKGGTRYAYTTDDRQVAIAQAKIFFNAHLNQKPYITPDIVIGFQPIGALRIMERTNNDTYEQMQFMSGKPTIRMGWAEPKRRSLHDFLGCSDRFDIGWLVDWARYLPNQ